MERGGADGRGEASANCFITDFYDIIWPHLFGNCHMRRPTGDYILAAGEWADVDIKGPKDEDPWLVLPHFWGTLTKA